ncbi:MAG: hypothetical protein L0Y55_21355 [Anaerolineales bacterium]|nr:hypothetical protein [Anaerolineales bacterium]
MQNTPQRVRTFLAALAVILGLFMVIGAPLLIQTSMDGVLTNLVQVSKERPQYSSGILLFSIFYPFWRALIFVGGVALIVSAFPIYQGKAWTLPVALLAYAMLAMGGMFMFLPYVSWVKGFPIPMTLMLVGLVGFWCMLLLRKTDRMQKLVDFLVLTFIGMLATHSFVLFTGALRMLMTRPGQPLFVGVEWWILTMVGGIDLLVVLMLVIAIPLLALRKEAGWWLALIASLSGLLIDAPTQVIRMATFDYLYGVLLAIGTLVFLLIPKFRQRLVE